MKITYTAKRNMVEQGLSVTNTDIYLQSSDNTIHCPTNDVSGLVADDWVLLSGANSEDGWHKCTASSNTSTITVSAVTSSIAAGSAIVVTAYKHGLDQTYYLYGEVSQFDESPIGKTKEIEMLDGSVETMYFNENTFWSITTNEIDEADMPYWREFFSSLRAGESFLFDAFGTAAADDNPIYVILQGNPRIRRVRTLLKYHISFRVKAL